MSKATNFVVEIFDQSHAHKDLQIPTASPTKLLKRHVPLFRRFRHTCACIHVLSTSRKRYKPTLVYATPVICIGMNETTAVIQPALEVAKL